MLTTGIIPKDIEKSKKYGFVHRACQYKLICDVLYMQGDELILRQVPWNKELYRVFEDNHEGPCNGHFALEITLHKIL